MNINPIQTEAEYESLLKEAELLFDAKPDTAEGDKLELIVMLLEKYEEEYFPISPPDPIEAIKFRMEQMGFK